MRPLIGITSYIEQARWSEWDVPTALIPFAYVSAVEAAGGRALIVPPSDGGVEETLDGLHGILFSGGADIDPAAYGAKPHPDVRVVRADRDRAEITLMEGAYERRMPILGICRGMQMLNVYKGGDLEQHLPDRTETPHTAPGEYTLHEVEINSMSQLARIIDRAPTVSSHHHQAPGRLGEGLRAAALGPDGTIEALEDPDADFCIGVLWHPEEDREAPLFEAFVEAARSYARAGRASMSPEL